MPKLRNLGLLVQQIELIEVNKGTPVFDDDLGFDVDPDPTEFVVWAGKGSLQHDIDTLRKAVLDVRNAGVEEVPMGAVCYLPFAANPKQHYFVQVVGGERYPQVSQPRNPGGANHHWMLLLGQSVERPQ